MADETPVEEAVGQAQATADVAVGIASDVGTELRRALEEHGRRIEELSDALAEGLGSVAGRVDELALRSHEHAAAAEPAPAAEPEPPAEAEDASHMTVEVEAPPAPPKKRKRFERARRVLF